MDKRQVREWREAYLAHNRQVIEERRAATVEERWRDLNDLYRFGMALGYTRRIEDSAAVRERWRRLREAHGRAR